MNKIYQRIDWENYPSSATPLNEDNLNKMDYAIDKLDDRIVTHETTKLNTATGNTLVKNVTFNEKTGVFTIEKLSGSKITINTALEKISTNFHFNPTTQKLVLTLIDGTVQEIDLSALITQYEFLESDTITFEIDTNGKVKANILNGSITGEKLEPNYLANVTLQAKNAKTSADNAKTSEELAYQYAEEARESASQTAKSDAKNITYDNTESGLSATNVKDALDEVAQGSVSALSTDTTITDSTNAPLIYGKFKGYTLQNGEPTPDNPVEINGLAKDGAIEVKTCGKNLINYDEWKKVTCANGSVVWENNGITITALQNDAYTQYYHDEQNDFPAKINVEEGEEYTLSWEESSNAVGHIYVFGQNNKAIAFQQNELAKEVTFTIPSGVTQISYRFGVKNAGVAISYKNIQIEKGSIATPYEPYTETTATIPTDAPLYEGDYLEVYADGSGKLVRKMSEITIDGSSVKTTGTDGFREYGLNYTYLWQHDKALTQSRVVANIGIGNINNNVSVPPSREGVVSNPNNTTVTVVLKDERTGVVSTDTSAQIVDKFNTWLQSNPVTVVYELAEPTETPLTAEQVAEFKKLYTFEPVTNVLCDGEVEIQYYKNTPSGVAVGTVHRMADNNKATYDGDGNVITETYVKKKPKYIIIMDSYGNPVIPNGGGTITPFINRLPALMGWSSNDYKASYQDGAGFGNGLFLSQLKTLRNSMTSAEAEEYTNIVVLGGYNDWQQTFISLKSAMQTFCDYAKTNFPNATVKIGYISGSRRAGDRYNLKIVPLNTYRCASLVGAVYLRNLEYVLHDNCYFLTGNNQYQHPLDIGHELLAPFIAEALKTGECTVARQHTRYKVTFASGITETVALYITSSQVNDQLTIANEVAFMTFNSNKTINDAEYFNIGTLPSECHIIGSYQSYEGNYSITVAYTDSADNSGVCPASIHFNGRTGDTGNVTVQLCLYTGGKTLTLKSICLYANSGLLSSNEC